LAKRNKTILAWLFTLAFVLFCCGLVLFRGYWWHGLTQGSAGEASGPEAVIDNYGRDFVKYGKEFNVPPEYLAALCMLECSGRKPAGVRYEKVVYSRLKMVKLRLRKNYEHVKPADLNDAEDEALQNLASSWGPFQLMGYKCLLYNIKVSDIRGKDATYWGVKWISEAYGKYLLKKDFKSAFHIHNAGMPYPASGKPKTYDPDYVNEGLRWMKYFKPKFQ